MGADALNGLGWPGKKADAVVAALRRDGKLLPLDQVFTFTDIGPEESQPKVTYPEAASFVKYLIAEQGLEKFRQAYKSLENSYNPATIERNRQTFREIYGKLPSELEPEWLGSLTSVKR